ncbi:MAG: hypothetical protein CSB16_01335 [Clostridiales bacterium]|nr:MAG: hypothetical protein CSB16_01335 [Clostridiales bacterium]
MSTILSILLGISLSAAAGFRVFVPFLFISISSKAGLIELSKGFAWMGTTPALILFLVATIVEIIAYYVPYIDNLLDMLAMPMAIIAGTILTATFITNMSPMLKWTLAIIAGGGMSAAIHGATAVTRGTSTLMTAGIGNNIVTTLENIFSTLISIVAILSPIIAILLIIIIVILFIRRRKRRNNKKENRTRNKNGNV